MKPVFALLSVLSVLLSSCAFDTSDPKEGTVVESEYDSTVDHLIAMNTNALGGEAALDAVRTMVKTSLIVEGKYRDIAVFVTDRMGRMRVDLFDDSERVFAESFDGTQGHQWDPKNGQVLASERGTIALSHTPQLPNHIFRLKDMRANGHSLEHVERDRTAEDGFALLKLTLQDGFVNYLWLDERNGLVKRVRNTRALHVDIDDEEKLIETRISDFRSIESIVHPHKVVEVDLRSGETLVDVTLLALQINTQIPEQYFFDLVDIVPERHWRAQDQYDRLRTD